MSRIIGLVILVLLTMIFVYPNGAIGDVSSDRGPTIMFVGESLPDSTGNGVLDISVQIDPIAFKLNSFNGYKLILVRIENLSENSVELSRSSDSFDLILRDSTPVRGILDLSQRDPACWDTLSLELRTVLAYPVTLAGNDVRYFYVLFPANQVVDDPVAIRYSIHDLGKVIQVERPHSMTKD